MNDNINNNQSFLLAIFLVIFRKFDLWNKITLTMIALNGFTVIKKYVIT